MLPKIAYIITQQTENTMKLSRFTIVMLVAFGCVAAITAQKKPEPKNPLVGHWFCEVENNKVEIRSNGSMTINGIEYAYTVRNSVINVVGEDGAMAFPFVLEGDTLTVEVD